jgi:hypothetical protein
VWLGNYSESNVRFGNRGIRSHSEKNKKGKIFGILSQLNKLSLSNDVHVKTFLAVGN